MVCVPCFVIPALLFIFRMVIQPLVYRIWGRRMQEPALSCPMPQKKKNLNTADNDSSCPMNSTKEIDESVGEENKKQN